MIQIHDQKHGLNRLFPGICALALTAALLCGCSGTGSMYTSEEFEEAESYGTGEEAAEESGRGDGDEAADAGEEDAQAPVRRAWLEGTGSELFTAQTVDSYYSFSLNGSSLRLPCRVSEIVGAGWVLALPGGGRNTIPPYSYEFYTAMPAGESGTGEEAEKNRDGRSQIRLCIGNDTNAPVFAADAIVYGIAAASDSGISLNTAFEAGIGSPLTDLTSVFGTDGSVCSRTAYTDGTCTVRYRFSNGLVDGERIPVLAEAEEKDLAELMTVRTDTDGSTITSVSLFYFRLDN